jgi:hypothetical protein
MYKEDKKHHLEGILYLYFTIKRCSNIVLNIHRKSGWKRALQFTASTLNLYEKNMLQSWVIFDPVAASSSEKRRNVLAPI